MVKFKQGITPINPVIQSIQYTGTQLSTYINFSEKVQP